jgi:hypothetical protein
MPLFILSAVQTTDSQALVGFQATKICSNNPIGDAAVRHFLRHF